MKRSIKKVAVLGSGVMGSRIACHFANIGVEVVLLDIVPRNLTDAEIAKNLSLENQAVRNRIVNEALQSALTSNPSPIYRKSSQALITTGNFEDNLSEISGADWVIEVIVENLDIKKSLFEKVEKYRKAGTIISSNTSGIPIKLMIDERSDDFKKHFCGTHFFNPPRYLRLLEIIPTKHTSTDVVEFLMDYGKRFLGKTTVLCKDTPAFIANRIGVYSIMALFHTVKEMGLSIEAVDKLTGPVLGRPKSATFRTADVVGLDTLVMVAQGLEKNCTEDEANTLFQLPDFIKKMVENKWLGSKTKQGFYKKVKNDDGSSDILGLDLETLTYRPKPKFSSPTLELTKNIDNLNERVKVLFDGKDQAGEFYKKSFCNLFQYVTNRIPEITEELYKIDDAMRAGFGWKLGPFQHWDAVGLKHALNEMKSRGIEPSIWINEMVNQGFESFYTVKDGKKHYYDIASKSYKIIPGLDNVVLLSNYKEQGVVWKNAGTTITDIGDGILNVEFHTKMNTIGAEILQGLNKAIDLAEEKYKGLVVYNEGDNFSAGANVGLIFMMAAEQEYDELEMAVRMFQKTMMRVRYSSIPVVAAPHNLTLGGGCELCLHADSVVAHAELYMGLVEFGVGVIPGGGGTKEFTLRLSDEFKEGNIRINQLRERFLTIGQAKVATSAHEAFDLGYLREGIDEVVVDRDYQLTRAKEVALHLANKGYSKPVERKDITVLGNEGLGIVYVGANSMKSGNYISDHDQLISEKLGYVMCGGDLSQPTKVSEQYLLDLERRAFVELCSQRKTLERLQSIIKTGKILRN